jgi:8-oxo-dGTP pyrophosphatase MutT (NUDIX family)
MGDNAERQLVTEFDICVGIVSAIVERVHDGEIEILVQTRWNKKYENVYNALEREVYEETGLKVLKIKPDIRTKMFSPRGDEAFAFVPFCGQQQTKGGVSRIGFVFICEVEDKPPVSQPEEVRNVRWMKTSELRRLLDASPEKIFTFQLGVLDYYLNHVGE